MSEPASLRVSFVLPSLRFTGGVRVVYEHARELRARGHHVTIVAPASRPGVPWTHSGRRALEAWLVDSFRLRPKRTLDYFGLGASLRTIPEFAGDHLPDAHVTVATSWATATPVASAPERCGRKAYFLQHYEVFEPGLEARVDPTWRLPLEKIVIAHWLARLARERFASAVWGPVPNGINFEQFHDRGRAPHPAPVVCMVYDLQPWKRFDVGYQAIRLARRQVPELQLRLFGSYRLRHELARGDRYERNPAQARIPEIYRESDVFVSPSWFEGWRLPPMESMACGCAVVIADSDDVPEFSIPGRTLLTAPREDPEAFAARIVALAKDPARRVALARAGHDYVQRFTWPAATDRLEECLKALARGESAR